MTNEKDREIASIIRSECFIDISETERPCFEWDLDTAANVIAKYRAEAVKAERERCINAAIKWWENDSEDGGPEDIRAAILSPDQGTDEKGKAVDSRTMFEKQMDEWGFVCEKNKNEEYKSPRTRQWWGIWRTAQDSMRSLLASEPEPCEDAHREAKNFVWKLRDAKSYDEQSAMIVERDRVKASQVADKRAEELRAQVETLRDAGLGILEDDDSGSIARLLGNWEFRSKKLREALAAMEPKP